MDITVNLDNNNKHAIASSYPRAGNPIRTVNFGRISHLDGVGRNSLVKARVCQDSARGKKQVAASFTR